MVTFDSAMLQASVDANGIAWILYPGPPCILWQLVEVDRDGATVRSSTRPAGELHGPILRAGSCHWRLSVHFCGAGAIPSMPVEEQGQVGLAGINALSSILPAISASSEP